MRLILCLLGAAGLVALGCEQTSSPLPNGDGSAPNGVDAAGGALPAGAAAFHAAFGQAACKHFFACPSLNNDDDLFARALFGTEARCQQLAGKIFERSENFDILFDQVVAGTLRYDRTLAAACVEAVGGCDADLRLDEVPPCREMFDGTVSSGGACFLDQDCAGPAYCLSKEASGFTNDCPGVCRPLLTTSEKCGSDATCAAGAEEFARCRPGGCEPFSPGRRARPGQPCGFVQPGVYVGCEAGSGCPRLVGAETGVCQAAIPGGQVCAATTDLCIEGLLCVEGGAGMTCAALPVANHVGDPCEQPGFPSVCDLFSSLACTGGACASLGDGGEGSGCGPDLETIACHEGLVCGSMARCVHAGATGAPCQSGQDCVSRTCVAKTCAARLCQVH